MINTLWQHKDEKYAEFQRSLIPSVKPETIIGIRTPIVREKARQLVKEKNYETFLNSLPHDYFEDNQLHAMIIAQLKDYDEVIYRLNCFLPYVDNWATCDQMIPKIFHKNQQRLLPQIRSWLNSDHPYTIRFGIEQLMKFYLKDHYQPELTKEVMAITNEHYYVRMMIAWYLAEGLAVRYQDILPFIENSNLDRFTHNKAIQKALESYRIPQERKDELRLLKK